MLFVQCIGRGLRTAPGKDHCLILDHADNHARLGFVTTIGYDALLKGSEKPQPKKKEKGETLPRECPSCGAIKPRGPCPSCGFEPSRQSEIEYEEGELIEIAPREEKPKATGLEKQVFWSMALALDRQRGKDGRLAKGLYKGAFGVQPRGLEDRLRDPSPEFRSYERSRRIAYAKSMEKRHA
jgi:superfamily II DNA or RNA helicase